MCCTKAVDDTLCFVPLTTGEVSCDEGILSPIKKASGKPVMLSNSQTLPLIAKFLTFKPHRFSKKMIQQTFFCFKPVLVSTNFRQQWEIGVRNTAKNPFSTAIWLPRLPVFNE